MKAWVKIGLTLMPEAEIAYFADALAWVQETDHSREFAVEAPILYSFRPGPVPSDRIQAVLLRRKSGILDVPYSFLVFGYGNEVFQIVLPSREKDMAVNGRSLTVPVYPLPGAPDPDLYGKPTFGTKNLTGRAVVSKEEVSAMVRFETATEVEPPESSA